MPQTFTFTREPPSSQHGLPSRPAPAPGRQPAGLPLDCLTARGIERQPIQKKPHDPKARCKPILCRQVASLAELLGNSFAIYITQPCTHAIVRPVARLKFYLSDYTDNP